MEDQDRQFPPTECDVVPFPVPDHDLLLTPELGFKYLLNHQDMCLQQKLQGAEITMRKVLRDNILRICLEKRSGTPLLKF